MGAKVQGRPKTRRPTCKCDLCGCSFLNIQALRTHQACLHPKTKRVAYKPKTEVIARRKVAPTKRSNVLRSRKPLKPVEEIVPKPTEEDTGTIRVRRSCFECPVCSKLFTVYFSAYRHIQNNHCVNDKGETVTPNSSSIIKPLNIEQCIKCNAKVDTEPHTCSEIITNNDETAVCSQTCLGCQEEFKSIHTFETHIEEEHNNDAEYFFFPDVNKFMTWKMNMETQMQVNYLVMTDKENHKVFHCNHFESNRTTSMSCPSSITTQVFSKGIQVAFYKKHFGHSSKAHSIPETFKNFHITSLVKNSEAWDETIINGNNTYSEFKRLMKNIVLEAAKVNLSNLRVLLGKAYEMTFVLNNHKSDNEKSNVQMNKTLTDDEISKFLDEPRQNKRTFDHSDTNVKKAKTDAVAKIEPRIIAKTDDNQNALLAEEEKNCEPGTKEVTTVATPIILNQLSKGEDNVKSSINSKIQSPTSFSDSYKNFVDANFGMSTEKTRTRKKEVMKTRIGQFKPNIVSTPKRREDNNKTSARKNSYFSPKGDIQYEVLERENDCNILIIKI